MIFFFLTSNTSISHYYLCHKRTPLLHISAQGKSIVTVLLQGILYVVTASKNSLHVNTVATWSEILKFNCTFTCNSCYVIYNIVWFINMTKLYTVINFKAMDIIILHLIHKCKFQSTCNPTSNSTWLVHAVFLYCCCPDCPSCLSHLNSTGWATKAIWAAAKKHSLNIYSL